MSLGWDTPRSTVFGRYMDVVGCDLARQIVGRGSPLPAFSSLRGASSQALTLLGEARFIAWCLKRPFLMGMADGARGILEPLGVSWLRPCARTDQKNIPTHTSTPSHKEIKQKLCVKPLKPYIRKQIILFKEEL